MTNLPPPGTPPRTDGRSVTETRYSQTSMWLVFLVLAVAILAAIAFGVNRSTGVTDPTEPATTEPATTEPATTGTPPVETVPADTGTDATDTGTATDADPGTGTADPAAPAPGTTGGTTQPAP
jgi:cytoskeletal protein RodZ